MSTTTCTHLDQIEVTELPATIAGCEECLKIGGTWVHLRMCMTCGKIGCCDDSPNRHATAHFHESNHPVLRSAEPGEEPIPRRVRVGHRFQRGEGFGRDHKKRLSRIQILYCLGEVGAVDV